MPCCVAFGCSTRNADMSAIPPLTFHHFTCMIAIRFPADEQTRKKWIQAVRREKWEPTKRSRLCSKHFKEEDFDRSPFYNKLKKGVVPSIFEAFPKHLKPKLPQKRKPVQRNEETSANSRSPSKKRLKKMLESSRLNVLDLETRLDEKNSKLDSATSSLNAMTDSVNSIKKNLVKSKKKVRILQQKTRRYQKIHCTLKTIISQLKEKSLLADEYADMLSSLSKTSMALYNRQRLRNTNPKLVKMYDDRLRSFAITLNFLSPKAYDFVRDQFDTCLPHRRTVGRWYSTVDASAGFSVEVLQVLEEKSKESPLIFSLIFDGMAIRKRVDWDGSRYYGYVDFGSSVDDDEAPLAQEALVFYLVGVNSPWKVPIGYFLINSITGEQLHNLMLTALEHLRRIRVTVTSITCDGASHHITMLKRMGFDFNGPCIRTIKCTADVEGDRVIAFLDPCHLLKLVRNTLHDYCDLVDGRGSEISWKYFELLHDLQHQEGLKLGNKLSNSHIFYGNNKMKVKLAAQLFSNSVADALHYCLLNKVKGFEGCEGTIYFVRIFNTLFDVLNSRSMRTRGFKQALNPLNIESVKSFFSEAKHYLTSLKNKVGVPIINTGRKLGFLGFLLDMESTLVFYNTYVEEKHMLKYFPTYKISQDHLERFFSYIRARGGRNNNQSCKEFKYNLRAILVHKQLHESSASSQNAIPLDKINILAIGPKAACPITEINRTSSRNKLLEEEESAKHSLDEDISRFLTNEPPVMDVNDIPDYLAVDTTKISNIAQDVIEYISGFIVRRLNLTLKCEECLKAVESNPNTTSDGRLLPIKDRGGLILPSVDVIEICKISEKLFRFKSKHKRLSPKSEAFASFLLKHCIGKNFFANVSHFLEDESHYSSIISAVGLLYFKTRMFHELKQFNDNLHREKIRARNNKLVLFKGQ